MTYLDFLKTKIEVAPVSGFSVSPEDLSPALKPHQRDAVIWALNGGRRALFESFGLGKTIQELEYCRLVLKHQGGKALIVLPLGVRQEFKHDATELLGMKEPQYITRMEEAAEDGTLYMTNYERVRDGDIDPKGFSCCVLDEAAVLRSFGSKTYQTFLPKFKGVKYKLVATATPAPNRLKELIHYAGFLEVMDTGQALTRFFQRDSTKANNLTLYPHKVEEFWLWVSSWALFVSKPSDLGYDATFQMISKEPELSEMAKKRRSDIYIADTNTTLKPLAFNAKKSDGLNISLGVCDEVASWAGDQGLKFYEVLKSSLGARRQPLLLSISTAGYVNEGTYDELMKRATGVLLGGSKETRFAPFLYTIDDLDKWNDINELRKSNPNLGVSVTVDYMLEEINIAEGSLSKKTEFLTKYCNIKQNSSVAWLSSRDVEKACRESFTAEDLRHSYCVGGIDLSQTTDLTSCCLVVEKSGTLYVLSHFFMPEARLEDATAEDGMPYRKYIEQGYLSLSGENYVDYRDCYNWIMGMIKQYELLPLAVGYDRYSAQYLVEELKAAGLKMDDVFQGHNLSPVIREFEGILKDGRIQIGGNNLLKAHMLNTALKQDTETQKVKMIKLGPRLRIDGTAALLDAMTVRQKWYQDMLF